METKAAIMGRRSIRKYTDQPVSKEDLQEVIEAGLHAPSGIDLQPWYIVGVHSPESMAKLKVLMERAVDGVKDTLEARFAKYPQVIEDTKVFIKSLGGAPACILAFLLAPKEDEGVLPDAVHAAVQNMLLMAYDKGLGTCWMTAPLEGGVDKDISAIFAPDKGRLLAAISIGHPAIEPRAPKRKDGRYVIL